MEARCYYCGTGEILNATRTQILMEICDKCDSTKPKFTETVSQRSPLHKRAIEKLGGKCVKCEFTDWRALQLDHIRGGGSKARKLKGTTAIYKSIVFPPLGFIPHDHFQVLCANCNWIKRIENRELKYKTFIIRANVPETFTFDVD